MSESLAIAAPRLFDGKNWHHEAALFAENGRMKTLAPLAGLSKSIKVETLSHGTLAGADLDLAKAVGVMHQQVGVELGQALRMAALYPAEAVGLDHGGRLSTGVPADFIWLDDNLQARAVWSGGKRIK